MVDRNSNETDKTQAVLTAEISSLIADAADCELVEMYVSSGSQAAVEALIRRHAPMVNGVIRRIIPKSSDADDAFQATFLVLLKSAKKIRKHSSIAAWLYGVAYRTACRARLRQHEKNTVHVDSTALPSQDYRDPLTRISEQFQLELLDRELQQLSSPIKETVIDHHLLGYTASQIADRMDVSISAVEGRLRRGRAALRHALSRRGISFSVAAVLAAKYQSTCHAATSSPISQLLNNDWFSNAIQNTSHVSVPKSLHSLASKDIATVTKALLPKFGLASAIAACSVAAVSTPILLTSPSGRSAPSILIGSANAQEPQATDIAFDGTAGSTGGGGGSAPQGAGASGFGSAGAAGGDAGFGSAAGGGPTGGGGSALPGGPGGSSGGGTYGAAYGGASMGGGSPYGGGGTHAPSGGLGLPYGAGNVSAGQGGYGGMGGLPTGGGAAPAGPGGYGGGAFVGSGSPGGTGMGTPGMPGAPTGPGGMGPGMSGGGFGGGGGASSESREYVYQGNKKPDWLTRGEDTIGEVEKARETIRTGLRKTISPSFNDAPLNDVLGYLSEASSISIGTTLANFDVAGINPDDPIVTLGNMSEISVGRALEVVLGSVGDKLTYIVEPEGIQVVNKDSERAKQRRYYDLSYMISDEETFFNVLRLVETNFDVDEASGIGSILMVGTDEPHHLKIEELLAQLARVPKENLLQNRN